MRIEQGHAGGFVLAELLGSLGRESVTVLAGRTLNAGAVVGRAAYGIGRVSIPTVVGTGTGTVSNVYAGKDVEVGEYVLTCTEAVAHGGVFSLVTPGGKALPPLTMTPGSGGSTTYQSSHLNFTITDATDFVEDDAFTFVVSTTAPTVIGGTGTGTMSALVLGPEAQPGTYRVICVEDVADGGRFQILRGGPPGVLVAEFVLDAGTGNTTVIETPHLGFSITDAADFIVGNYFDVCVFNQRGGGKAVAWDPTVYDGRHRVAGVLVDRVDASLADARGVLIHTHAVVRKADLSWAAGITSAQQDAAYAQMRRHTLIAHN